MRTVANSPSPFLNPDTNPVLRAIIKPFIYDQFCAGTNTAEVQSTIGSIQKLGFAGVILCYAKEIQLDETNAATGAQGQREADIQKWLHGNLETLDMAPNGNWLGMKYTGAGQDVTEALLRGDDPPPAFSRAMNAIAEKARSQGVRIWIDAEQQAIQPSIDRWTVDLMRKFNIGTNVLIHNTIQCYLKDSRPNLRRQLETAQKEGWNMGVKLVRGAYIAAETRERIHDTKADTDASYNGIVRDLLAGKFEGLTPENFPRTGLFLAGHNSESIRKALSLAKELAEKGELKVSPEFGQLQGMADDIGGEIVQFGEALQAETPQLLGAPSPKQSFVPRAYKCLTWGTIQECMQYLVRRAVENSAAVDRMRESAAEARKELVRRLISRKETAAMPPRTQIDTT